MMGEGLDPLKSFTFSPLFLKVFGAVSFNSRDIACFLKFIRCIFASNSFLPKKPLEGPQFGATLGATCMSKTVIG